MANKKIEIGSVIDVIDPIKPAKKYIPEWYKKAESFIGGSMVFGKNGVNPALKSCIPFMDTLTSGYMAELWTDLYVEQTEHGPFVRWPNQSKDSPIQFTPFEARGPEASHPMPVPNGYSDIHFTWHNPYLIKVPFGYSVLLTHPLNRYDLPFFTLSGIVDCDTDVLSAGRIPFFVKEGFEGVIPKGTPIYQVIPFKRDNWDSEVNPDLKRMNDKRSFDIGSVLYGWYKKTTWKRKEYN
jgi:hypothetical protein